MQSVPQRYHPDWYQEYVKTFEKYYPEEKKEIDDKEKLELSELIKNYENELINN